MYLSKYKLKQIVAALLNVCSKENIKFYSFFYYLFIKLFQYTLIETMFLQYYKVN